MSKIGLKVVKLNKAEVSINGQQVAVKGPKGQLTYDLPEGIVAILEEDGVVVRPVKDSKNLDRKLRAIWGTARAIIANNVRGVEDGFETKVQIVGLGYKAVLNGNRLNFSLGYSHKIDLPVPDTVSVDVSKTGQEIVVRSIDKFELGKFCSKLKALKPVEPYKGTGIFIEGEKIFRKAGKAKKA